MSGNRNVQAAYRCRHRTRQTWHGRRTWQTLLALVEPSRAEEGCVSYDMHQSKDDPAVWLAYENWRSEEDLALHFEKPYLKAFGESGDEVLAEPVDVRKFTLRS